MTGEEISRFIEVQKLMTSPDLKKTTVGGEYTRYSVRVGAPSPGSDSALWRLNEEFLGVKVYKDNDELVVVAEVPTIFPGYHQFRKALGGLIMARREITARGLVVSKTVAG